MSRTLVGRNFRSRQKKNRSLQKDGPHEWNSKGAVAGRGDLLRSLVGAGVFLGSILVCFSQLLCTLVVLVNYICSCCFWGCCHSSDWPPQLCQFCGQVHVHTYRRKGSTVFTGPQTLAVESSMVNSKCWKLFCAENVVGMSASSLSQSIVSPFVSMCVFRCFTEIHGGRPIWLPSLI